MILGLAASAVLLAAARAQSPASDPVDQSVRIPRIVAGPIRVGEDHPLFDLSDFPVSVDPPTPAVDARWVGRSIRWFRAPSGLAFPQARLRVSVSAPPERASLRWRGRAIAFQGAGEDSTVEFFVPLLEGGEAAVALDGRPLARVRVRARPAAATASADRHGIDHSCSPWRLTVEGLDDALASFNCRLVPVGRLGAEEPLLDVRWAAAGVSPPDGGPSPFSAQLRDSRPARTTVLGPDGKPRVVSIAAAVPSRWHRLRLAGGAGPYNLSSTAGAGNGPAGSLMLYANLGLRPEGDLSLRAFEAAVSRSPMQTAFFNNLGLYFAYDAAKVWDGRLRVTALLGMQGVTFAPGGLARRSYSTVLFPQGFELAYLDAFGLRNRTLSAGMFLQAAANKPYQNLWLRFGGRWFAELNYLSWRAYDREARMWGVSLGFPLAQWF